MLVEGIEWKTLAVHNPVDYVRPARVSYDLPSDARANGVQLRWWQPRHRGAGHDQWAIDYVEIVVLVSRDCTPAYTMFTVDYKYVQGDA